VRRLLALLVPCVVLLLTVGLLAAAAAARPPRGKGKGKPKAAGPPPANEGLVLFVSAQEANEQQRPLAADDAVMNNQIVQVGFLARSKGGLAIVTVDQYGQSRRVYPWEGESLGVVEAGTERRDAAVMRSTTEGRLWILGVLCTRPEDLTVDGVRMLVRNRWSNAMGTREQPGWLDRSPSPALPAGCKAESTTIKVRAP
jgi:hypothetical protein